MTGGTKHHNAKRLTDNWRSDSRVALTNLLSPVPTESLLQKNFVWSLPVAGFKTSRFRKPAPPAIQHVSFLFRRSYYDPTRPSFSRHRMAVMRSPGYTRLFMHENVPAPISAPTRIRIGHPKKDLLHTSEQQRYSPEQKQWPESTADWRITSRDMNSDLTFFECCENDRIRNDSENLLSTRRNMLHNPVAIAE